MGSTSFFAAFVSFCCVQFFCLISGSRKSPSACAVFLHTDDVMHLVLAVLIGLFLVCSLSCLGFESSTNSDAFSETETRTAFIERVDHGRVSGYGSTRVGGGCDGKG